MTAGQQNEAFLLGQFREFYTEIIRLKELIENSGVMNADVVDVSDTPSSENGHGTNGKLAATGPLPRIDPAMLDTLSSSEQITSLAVRGAVDTAGAVLTADTRLTQVVRNSLLDLFKRNAVDILRAGKPTENLLEAQYVMAVFADDVFINLDWEGKRSWTSNLLESRLFHTHIAGESFFERLDRLLRDRDPAERSLAVVYLNALALGFRGKYRGMNDHGRLSRYRHELFAFIFRQPADLADDSKIAFPDSYVQNVRKEKSRKLTNPRVWVAVLGLVLFAYLAVSHGLWMKLTSRIDQANKQIVELERRLDTLPPPLN